MKKYSQENFLKQVFQDKFAKFAFIILICLYVAVFSANFLSCYPKDYSDRQSAYAPPSKIYIINQEGKLSKPYTYNYVRTFDKNTYHLITSISWNNKNKLKNWRTKLNLAVSPRL